MIAPEDTTIGVCFGICLISSQHGANRSRDWAAAIQKQTLFGE
jgi:hypothetical protein